MITLEGVSKTFATAKGEVRALAAIDLSIGPGEIFGIIGHSGAGKSTLIRCINLLERPTAGRVTVDGRDLTALEPADLNIARRSIGMIFQHFNLLSSRTVYENVALPMEIAGADRAAVRAAVGPLLDLVGLSDKADRYPATLSGGQKQRVGIARALANKPKVLLCDEATSALDPETTRSILALLKDINRELGLTIALITHEMSVIKQIASRVAVLEAGRIIETGPVFDVFTRPRSDLTKAFVADFIGSDLPPTLAERAATGFQGRLIRVLFTGAHADEAVISEVSRRYSIDLNLQHGRIDTIQGRPFGTLWMVATGASPNIDAAIGHMRALKLDVEEVGDVASDDRAAS